MNGRSGGICRYGCSHSQICNKLVWSPCILCGILWRWYKQKPTGCRILHTCVCSKSSCKFYAYWYFGLVAVLPEHHLIHTTVVHILHLLMERNHRILCMGSNVLWCVWRCQYSATAALPFPLQKSYTKSITPYSPSGKLLGYVLCALRYSDQLVAQWCHSERTFCWRIVP